MPRDLKRKYLLVANAPNCEDVVALLRAILDRVADIRTDFAKQLPAGQDSIEVRQAAAFILTDTIDQLHITRKTELQRKSGVVTESDAESESLDTDADDDLM